MEDTASTGTKAPLQRATCVADAAADMLAAACGLQLSECEDGDLGADGAVIGVISLVGDIEWSIFLGLPRQTAETLAVKFAGFEIPFDSEDMGDAVGELTNILAGDVKRRLEGMSLAAQLSLPSVVRAESLHVLVQRGTSVLKSCFDSEAGKLWTGVMSANEGGLVA